MHRVSRSRPLDERRETFITAVTAWKAMYGYFPNGSDLNTKKVPGHHHAASMINSLFGSAKAFYDACKKRGILTQHDYRLLQSRKRIASLKGVRAARNARKQNESPEPLPEAPPVLNLTIVLAPELNIEPGLVLELEPITRPEITATRNGADTTFSCCGNSYSNQKYILEHREKQHGEERGMASAVVMACLAALLKKQREALNIVAKKSPVCEVFADVHHA